MSVESSKPCKQSLIKIIQKSLNFEIFEFCLPLAFQNETTSRFFTRL